MGSKGGCMWSQPLERREERRDGGNTPSNAEKKSSRFCRVKMMEGGEGGGREGRGVRRRCVRGQSDSVLTGALCLSPPRLSSIHPLWGEWPRDCRLQPPLGSDSSVGETPRIWLAIASWPKKKRPTESALPARRRFSFAIESTTRTVRKLPCGTAATARLHRISASTLAV